MKSRSGVWILVGLLLLAALLSIISRALFLDEQRKRQTRAQQDLTVCKENLEKIRWSLTFYRANNGHYPISLSELVPKYIELLPHCPTTAIDTYSTGYESKREEGKLPPSYRCGCKGENHVLAGTPADRPEIDSFSGGTPLLP